jgi:hypothetical protein
VARGGLEPHRRELARALRLPTRSQRALQCPQRHTDVALDEQSLDDDRVAPRGPVQKLLGERPLCIVERARLQPDLGLGGDTLMHVPSHAVSRDAELLCDALAA